MTQFIAIICGLKSEAAAVRGAVDDERVRIGVSGANAGRAEKIAEGFCKDGAAAVVSIGVSGGLDPALEPGDLIIGDRVITGDGAAWASDISLLKSLVTSPQGAGVKCGSLYGSDEIIASAEEKSSLFEKTAALAVDMESHGAARAAARAGIPFIAIRAVADPADRALPKAALGAVAEDGSTRMLTTLFAAMRDPKQFPELIKLGGDSNAGLKTLREFLGPLFAILFGGLFSSNL